jgi:hypothetical protein
MYHSNIILISWYKMKRKEGVKRGKEEQTGTMISFFHVAIIEPVSNYNRATCQRSNEYMSGLTNRCNRTILRNKQRQAIQCTVSLKLKTTWISRYNMHGVIPSLTHTNDANAWQQTKFLNSVVLRVFQRPSLHLHPRNITLQNYERNKIFNASWSSSNSLRL